VASYSNLHDADIWNVAADAAFYATPQLRLNAGAAYANADNLFVGGSVDGWSVGVGAEYQFADTPYSVFGGYDYAKSSDLDVDANVFKIGMRYSFGGGLQARDQAGANLGQLNQMKKMGGLQGIMGLLPGVAKLKNQMAENNVSDKMIDRQLAVINSMTKAERKKPDLLNASRKKRVAKGAGVEVQDINRLLKQHRQMADMVKSLSKGGGKNLQKMASMMGGLPGMGGGGPDMNRLKALGGGKMPEPSA
jgi:hypothetical protein